MTDPDMQVQDPVSGVSIIGTMTDPFINNSGDSLDPALAGEGYYGSGMYALSNDYGKLGPYNEGDAVARHQHMGSDFHRDVDFCGTCHDVSNSAVGQLAPNGGTQPGAPALFRSAELGFPFNPNLTPNDPAVLDGMAAFNNPPYAYGIVERTFSEYKSSPLSSTPVDAFGTLPADLQDPRGSLYAAFMASTTQDTRSGNYIPDPNGFDADERFFSCQTCHMRAITGRGCDKADAPNRLDQPMHDQTGGNYWVYPLVQWQDQQGTLRLGGGLSAEQIEAMDDGMLRAGTHLTQAGTLDVNGDIARITNMTGHKLISGYPEGRRMWLNIKFYDNQNNLIEEIGEWGPLPTTATNPVDGTTFTPWSIVDLDNPKLKVYEVHPAMTKEWADVLLSVGYPETMPLSFDRLTGQPDFTLGDLAALPAGGYHETFHFVLNNYVGKDNRIPPYQMSYDLAKDRNALPVPADQYGGSPGGVYEHWDEYDIKALAPSNAAKADLTLYYQGTSWEYVQFLNNAVSSTPTGAGAPNPVTPFLAEEGQNYLDAWVNATHILPGGDPQNPEPMVPPYPMATATWSDGGCVPVPEICDDTIDNDCDLLVDCSDPDCNGDPACPELIEWPDCFDGLDNDFDGLIDCEDRTDCDGEQDGATSCGIGECATTGFIECRNGAEIDTCTPLSPPENNEVSCFDGLDNDCNAFTDCADANCDGAIGDVTTCGVGECAGNTGNLTCSAGTEIDTCDPLAGASPEVCTGGLDEDCDGLIDCDDPDCSGDQNCQTTCTGLSRNVCKNTTGCEWVGGKNGECLPAAVCEPTGPEAGNCDDTIDNDCNGLTDCADTDACGADPLCQMDCSMYTKQKQCVRNGCTWDGNTCLNP
jgi:hypothetical protein